MDHGEQTGLNHLSFQDGGGYLNDRLLGKDNCPFRSGEDFSGKTKFLEEFEKFGADASKRRLMAKELHIGVRKAERGQVIQRGLDAGRYQERALRRQLANKQLECRDRPDPVMKVPGGHGQFIKIHQKASAF